MRTISFLLMLLIASIAHAQTAKPKDVDQYGDTLPEGAIARLGTVRFRHGSSAEAIAYSPNGKVIASVGRFLGVCIWDAETGRLLHQVPVHRFASSVTFSADGKKLATTLNLIDVETGKERFKFYAGKEPEFTEFATTAAFSPDGTIVATAGFLGGKDKIVFWDAETGKQLRFTAIKNDEGRVAHMAFSKDGKLLASRSFDKTIRIWEVASGKQIHRLEGHDKMVLHVAFLPDGNTLISIGEDGAVHLWNVESGKMLRQLKTLDADRLTIALTVDAKTLALGGYGGVISLWDLSSGKELRRWETHVRYTSSLAFTPDGKKLASAASGVIRQWDPETGKELKPTDHHRGPVLWLNFSPDAKTLLTYDSEKKIFEWQLGSRQQNGRQFSIFPARAPDEVWITVDISPDGKTIAQSSMVNIPKRKFDPVVRLWDTATGKERLALKGHADRVDEVQFSPNGKLLASIGSDGVRIWDVESGKSLHHMLDNVQTTALAFAPDGKSIFSASSDAKIRQWNTETGKETHAWATMQARIEILKVSPDGRAVATRDSNSVNVWDVKTGKEVMRVPGESVYSIAFSPTGRVLAGGWFGSKTNDDSNIVGYIKYWEVRTGQEIRQTENPQTLATALAFAPDGITLASGGYDSTVLIWDTTGHGKAKQPLTAKDLDALWSDLRGDAAKADRALWTLTLSPQKSLPFLKERLQPAPAADAKTVARLIGDLENMQLDVRQKAESRLIELGESAELVLQQHLKKNPSLEMRRRVEQILAKREPEILRQLRAIDVLEQIGTGEAREVLESQAKTTPTPCVAQAIEAACSRMKTR